MKTKLPTFIELYRQLIATSSISSVDVNRDQSETLINLLVEWLTTLGCKINIQLVPDTRHKFNLLATFVKEKADYCSVGIQILFLLMTDTGQKIPFN